jgi:hypothetical protein
LKNKVFDMPAKKLSHRISIHLRLALVIAIVFSLQACTADKNGAGTPDRVVEQYLMALEDRDQKLMLRLAPENSILTKEIKAKIDKIGGHKIQSRQIIYDKSTPILWSAKMRGIYVDRQGANKKFEDSIVIQYQNKGDLKLYAGRWYLLLEGMK